MDICYDDELGERSGNGLIVCLFISIKSKFHIQFGTNVFPDAVETFIFHCDGLKWWCVRENSRWINIIHHNPSRHMEGIPVIPKTSQI